ncbi:MAG TPA: Lrp/AsnC family transcriptional regulator [Steroidobacteraceae bacterium]|nr:Lrp/AsnC family transcriptional regulator [Steroidobacteraceae bacterium]
MHRTAKSLDDLDRKLLDLLQQDAGRSLDLLGETIGLSPSAVQRRLTRYRASGLIAKEVAVLDPDVMPGTVLACVLVTLERESKRHHSSFRDRMRAAPNVQQCYDLAGEWDYLAIVVASSMTHCRSVLNDLFMDAPNVQRFETLFVFDAVKRGLNIPLR